MKIRNGLLGLAIAALLAGCAGDVRVYNGTISNRYSRAEFGFAAGRRDLATVIRGDPFDMGEGTFEAALLEVIARHPPRPQPARLTTDPGPDADLNYHAVFLFDAPTSLVATSLCSQPPSAPVVETGDLVRVIGAFCIGSGALTQATGEAVGVTGVDDPKFDRLIAQMMAALFPLSNPNRDRGNRPVLLPG